MTVPLLIAVDPAHALVAAAACRARAAGLGATVARGLGRGRPTAQELGALAADAAALEAVAGELERAARGELEPSPS